ncbi:MAG: hypothetical protein KBG12_00970 [Syntrophobacterales bacterium]|nr:hypothetical protein [Syntrophobacterales bacterium]
MRVLREHDNHFITPFRSWFGLFLASCFAMGLVALAMHHHDAYFLLKNCAICKAKTSLSATISKIKADISASAVIESHNAADVYLTSSRLKNNHPTPFVVLLLPNSFFNKSPPFPLWNP